MNEERSFGSKHAYLSIELPESLHFSENNASKWTIEDEGRERESERPSFPPKPDLFLDGFKICDGELMRHSSDPMLLDYIPREKQVGRLKYEFLVNEGDRCIVLNGVVEPLNQTDSTIEFSISITPWGRVFNEPVMFI